MALIPPRHYLQRRRDEQEEHVFVGLMYLWSLRRRQLRRVWVWPWIQRCQLFSQYQTLMAELERESSSVRNIGAVIDSQMQMLEQVNSICRSCYSSLYSISRVRKYLTTEATQTLVHAFISCRLDNSLLSGVPQYMLAKLQLVQNNAARIIVRKRKSDHISLTLKELHWLPIEARVEFKILLLTFKALNGTAPLYLTNLVRFKENACVLWSGSEQYLEVQPTRLKSIGVRAFAAIAPRLWNSIPVTIRNSANVNIFKRAVKTHLFRSHYNL